MGRSLSSARCQSPVPAPTPAMPLATLPFSRSSELKWYTADAAMRNGRPAQRAGVVAGADGDRAGAIREVDDPREPLPDAVVRRSEQRPPSAFRQPRVPRTAGKQAGRLPFVHARWTRISTHGGMIGKAVRELKAVLARQVDDGPSCGPGAFVLQIRRHGRAVAASLR